MAYLSWAGSPRLLTISTTSLRLVPDLDRALFQRGRPINHYGNTPLQRPTCGRGQAQPATPDITNQLALACSPPVRTTIPETGRRLLSHAGTCLRLSDGTDAVILDTRAVAHADAVTLRPPFRWVEAALAWQRRREDVLGETAQAVPVGQAMPGPGS